MPRNKPKYKKSKKESVEENVPSISYFALFRYASRCDKFLIFVALLAAYIAGTMTPLAITLVADMFQTMIDYSKALKAGNNDDAKFLSAMHWFGVKYSSVGVVLFVCGYLGSALMNITAINQILKLREAYLKAALTQDFAYFDTRRSGDFASKAANDMIKVEEGIGDKLSMAVFNVSVAVGCILMALLKGWKLALLCLASAPISFFLVGLTGKLAQCLSKKGAAACARAGAVAEEVLSSIRTVYAFNGQQEEIRRYRVPLAEARKIDIKKEFYYGLSGGFLFCCLFGSYALSFYVGVYLIINDPNHYNADVMFAVFFGVMTGMANFGMIAPLVGTFGSAIGAGAHVFHLINNVPAINPLLEQGLKPDSCEGDVELKDVVFHYPSRPEMQVLKGVNIVVKRGQSVALVGHSGCGKSTIIQLISRYYDVVEGQVSLDGRDVRDLSVRWLRAQIGLVGQEPVLFNTSVRENIRYGREDATDAEIEAAAKQANAHKFVTKLPKGYDTLVGERGASLSGGQKQRIAIARALIRNPSILLLDEATSALDTSSEAQVQKALDKASQGRSTVTVAHRLSTIRHVDFIYVMQDGVVVESGNHRDLVDKKGHYHTMLALQGLLDETANDLNTIGPRLDQKESDAEAIDETIPEVESEDDSSEPPPYSFGRVVRMNSPEWKWITAGSVCSVVMGFSMPIFVVVFGLFFGSLTESDPDVLMGTVVTVSSVCAGIGLLIGTSNTIESLCFGVAGSYLTERLRQRMFEHLLRQHIGFFDKQTNSTGALCAKLSTEAAYVQGATGQRIGVLLQGIGSVGLALILALIFEWRVGLVVLSFFPVVGLVVYFQGKATYRESFGTAKMLENSTKIAIEAISNIRTVACLGREREFLREYATQLQPAVGPAKRAAHLRGLVSGMSRSMFNFINATALTYGGHLMVTSQVLCQNILITTQSLQMASGHIQSAFSYTPDFQKGIHAASRVDALLKAEPGVCDPVVPKISPFVSSGAASLTDVEFRYPTRPGIKVLRGLNLQMAAGKTTALVGQSGHGKSTIVGLMERFYDPEHGVVTLDETPLPSLMQHEVRVTYGLVSQEPALFNRSVWDNISYGAPSRAPAPGEVVRAAEQADIHNFIIALPQGYETNIGLNGVQLSGGQKQRVAIARALIRNPKILLLDEATSALDTHSEKVVQEALDRAKAGRTCVMIAHRLSTVRDADVICVVSEGRVIEQGNHADLMDRKGAYHRLHTQES